LRRCESTAVDAKINCGLHWVTYEALEEPYVTRKIETFTRYDTADYLESEEDVATYISACAQEDDPALFLAALGDVARAWNITQLAAKTGLTRMELYKALSGSENPSFAIVSKVAHALGFKIILAAA